VSDPTKPLDLYDVMEAIERCEAKVDALAREAVRQSGEIVAIRTNMHHLAGAMNNTSLGVEWLRRKLRTVTRIEVTEASEVGVAADSALKDPRADPSDPAFGVETVPPPAKYPPK
jgi:hypothetical protein